MTAASPRKHRFGLDLLRAAAVVMVVSCHAGLFIAGWYGGRDPQHAAVSGFFGVEAFFVLSGFLIGRILLATVAARPDRRTLGLFLRRRWARTLPLYALCLAVLAFVLPPQPSVRAVLPWFATLTQNFAWKTVGFWFPVSWSLAVEEWFYVLFPLLLAALARRWSPMRAAMVATGVFLVVPLVLRALVPSDINWNNVARQIVVLRLDAIAFGVAACLLDAGRWGPAVRRHRVALAAAGLGVLLLQWWGGLQGTGPLAKRLHDVFASDIADGGWALTLFALDAMPTPRAVFARPVRLLAERSYGLYLVHLSLLEVADRLIRLHGWPRGGTIAGVASLCVILPSLSWRCLEKPILDRVRGPAPRRAPPPGALSDPPPAPPRDGFRRAG